MESDHQKGRCLCRLNVAFAKLLQERPGIAPAFFWLFFGSGLLYKAHNHP